MENQLLKIREIIKELIALDDAYDYYSLPAKVEVEFETIRENLLQIWADKPANLDQILDLNFQETLRLMAEMSAQDVNHGDVKELPKGAIGFRREINTCIFNGLLQVFSQIQQLKTGDELSLSLKTFS